MNLMEIIDEIETCKNYIQDGLDYEMDCIVVVNNVHTRCDQISVVTCDLRDEGKGIEALLELRRGDWITWLFLEDVKSLKVNEYSDTITADIC